MRFIHKLKIDDFVNHGNKFEPDNYMGIDFTLESEIFDNNIGMFIKVKLPYGYEKIDTKIRFGILNSKNNICNKYIFDYTFSHNNYEVIGNKTFISKSNIGKYNINGDVYVGFEIVKCEYERNHVRMIQKMYEILSKDNNIGEFGN